jgi:hypothetical protein
VSVPVPVTGYTSIKERLEPTFNLADAIQSQREQLFLKQLPVPLKPLLNFQEAVRNEPQRGILFSLNDYLELIDYTGRIVRPGKRGSIPDRQPTILQRLGLTTDEWLAEATEFEARYQDNRRAHLDRRRSAA